MSDKNAAPWLNGHPDYDGWMAEYGGKVWGEVGKFLHPPTEEGRWAAEQEGQEWVEYYASKTDDEDNIEELYSRAFPVDPDGRGVMCDCCDWGYGWMGEG